MKIMMMVMGYLWKFCLFAAGVTAQINDAITDDRGFWL